MLQFVFIALFVITLFAGFFSYFAPTHKSESFVRLMEDKSGYSGEQSISRKRTQRLNMIMSQGLVKIHKQMDNLAVEQSKFLDALKDQQQVLRDSSHGLSDIMLITKQEGEKENKDLLQLKDLAAQMQDQQRLLINHGRDLIVLNDEVTQNRQSMSDQVNWAQLNVENSLSSLMERNVSLNNQAADLFDKITDHNQQVQDQMFQMQARMRDLVNSAAYDNAQQKQNIRGKIGRMLAHVREAMRRLQDNQDRVKILLEDAKERQAQAKELLNDKMEEERDKINEEHQKQEDQEMTIREHIADQQQRTRDQQQQMKDQQEMGEQRMADQMQNMGNQRIADQMQHLRDQQAQQNQ